MLGMSKVTSQILVVSDFQGPAEDVLACCDDVAEARKRRALFQSVGIGEEFTLVRVRMVEVVE